MPLAPFREYYSPIIDRPKITWPNDARVAFWIAPNVEHYEYLPNWDGKRNPWPRTPHPDVQQYSYRDYGNRVGFWRMLEPLDKHNIRCTVSLNLSVLEHFPEIAEAMMLRNWEIMSHGFYNTEFIQPYTEDQERQFYRDSIDIVKRNTGQQLRGMLAPYCSITERTPDLMAEAGLIYHTDWMHDDQPAPLKVQSGKMISVPYSCEVNDGSIFRWSFEGDDLFQACKDQFDVLYEEGGHSGRVMCIPLHPFMIGQPHRVKYLEQTLDYIMSHDGVWQATAGEIADHYYENNYDEAIAYSAWLAKECL